MSQASVPIVTLLSLLLPRPPEDQDSPETLPRPLRLKVLYCINHLSPAECVQRAISSHVTYRALGAALIAMAIVAVVNAPPADASNGVFTWGTHPAALVATDGGSGGGSGGGGGGGGGGTLPSRLALSGEVTTAPEMTTTLRAALPAETGRGLFLAGTAFGALSSVYKRRCLQRQPTDLLLMNTCLSALQLFTGLLMAPPLLLILHGQPIRETLLGLARGLRCCMSGFNAQICTQANDAYGVRLPHTIPAPAPQLRPWPVRRPCARSPRPAPCQNHRAAHAHTAQPLTSVHAHIPAHELASPPSSSHPRPRARIPALELTSPPSSARPQTPVLLTFFITSTSWSAASFSLLHIGGEPPLAVGSALLLPMALLAFVRPVSLPYDWAAPPQNLSPAELSAAVCLLMALVVYHSATLVGSRSAKAGLLALSTADDSSDASGERVSPTELRTELVGPSLRL